MKNLIAGIALVSLLFCSVFSEQARALIIDQFNDNSGRVCSNEVGVTVSNNTASVAAVGGIRTLSAIKTSGILSVCVESKNAFLLHSQDAGVAGGSRVLWNAGSSNIIGLPVLDLTQDGGNAISLKGVYFDYANQKSVDLIFTVYDASDVLGQKSSSYSLKLDSSLSGKDFTLPFANFNVPGPLGLADFRNVGAISLTINGANPDVDLTFDAIMTNGKCEKNVPDNEGKVVDSCGLCPDEPGYKTSKDDCGVCFGNNKDKDECGVCFGNNKDKDQCGVCFGDNKDMDQCGVCFGNNRDLDDCGICGGNNLSKDLCGICGGDNNSCKDCLGVPNGNAKYDVCGICAGDGT
ncbi:MAG: hypothetical protein GYA55_13560, partial [SAR324 cluster bacterium]|nr:hypothetical protein [SAR324 cluster bacterium]